MWRGGVSSNIGAGNKPVPDQFTSVGEDSVGRLGTPARHSGNKDNNHLAERVLPTRAPASRLP